MSVQVITGNAGFSDRASSSCRVEVFVPSRLAPVRGKSRERILGLLGILTVGAILALSLYSIFRYLL